MSTLEALEAAILAHHRDATDADSKPERAGAVITGWVIAYEFSNLVDIEGEGTVVGFQNEYITSDGSPNQHTGLTQWAGSQISIDAFSSYNEGDDD